MLCYPNTRNKRKRCKLGSSPGIVLLRSEVSHLKLFERLLQGVLFPGLEQQLGPLSDKHRQLVKILGLAEVESLVAPWMGGAARP